MKKSTALNWLVPLIVLLALATALTGLLSNGGGAPFTFTTLHGNEVEIYGRGIYRNDTIFSAAAFKGTDAVTIFLGLPLLVVSFWLYRRGSLRGGLFLAGVLSYFTYNGASMSFSAAFNSLFLVYTALFSASMFALIVALNMFDLQALSENIAPGMPHRGLGAFMFIAGLGTLFLWISELVGPLLAGEAPELLGPYTTLFTHAFDSAVITPAAVLTGFSLLRRKPLGYLLAAPILILCTLIGVVVLAQTASQTLAGITFPIGVYIGMVGSWVVMGAFAVWLTLAFFQNLPDAAASSSLAPAAEYA